MGRDVAHGRKDGVCDGFPRPLLSLLLSEPPAYSEMPKGVGKEYFLCRKIQRTKS